VLRLHARRRMSCALQPRHHLREPRAQSRFEMMMVGRRAMVDTGLPAPSTTRLTMRYRALPHSICLRLLVYTLQTRAKAAPRLDLGVSAGWASPSSHCLVRCRHSAALQQVRVTAAGHQRKPRTTPPHPGNIEGLARARGALRTPPGRCTRGPKAGTGERAERVRCYTLAPRGLTWQAAKRQPSFPVPRGDYCPIQPDFPAH